MTQNKLKPAQRNTAHPRMANYFLAVGAVIGVICLIEIGSALFLKIKQASSFKEFDGQSISENLYVVDRDADLGQVPKKNNINRTVKKFADGKVIYDFTCRNDEYRRRTVGQPILPGNRNLILFGCSFIYGEGLNDHDTLQYHLWKKMPQFNIYNYAVIGYGPNQMLALLQARDLSLEIGSSKEAVAVYVLVEEHIDRAIGSMRANWAYDAPYYRLIEGGALERKGSFHTGRALITQLYLMLDQLKARSSFLKLINFNLPMRYSERDIRLTAEIIKASKDQYLRQFRGKFYVLMHPQYKGTKSNAAEELRDLLKSMSVDVLYYPIPAGHRHADYKINKGDLHPNGKLNEFLAGHLARDLNLKS